MDYYGKPVEKYDGMCPVEAESAVTLKRIIDETYKILSESEAILGEVNICMNGPNGPGPRPEGQTPNCIKEDMLRVRDVADRIMLHTLEIRKTIA